MRPQQCTFVPDESGAFTSDHGWNLPAQIDELRPMIEQAKSFGARVSLFMDPVPEAMQCAAAAGADRVELYTEPYAKAFGTPAQAATLARYASAAEAALRVGVGVNAGHDLNRHHLAAFLARSRRITSVVGHALISDAMNSVSADGAFVIRPKFARLKREAASDDFRVGIDIVEIDRIAASMRASASVSSSESGCTRVERFQIRRARSANAASGVLSTRCAPGGRGKSAWSRHALSDALARGRSIERSVGASDRVGARGHAAIVERHGCD